MKSIKSLIKNNVPYFKDNNVIRFIFDENARPDWSKVLNHHLETDKIDLEMSKRYQYQKSIVTKDERRKRFVDFISAASGAKVDLASGPSGYFAPILDTLAETDLFIATDACPSVIAAHSSACNKDNFFVFDMDLDKEFPFADECVNAFSGNLLNNVNNYAELIREVYRCLKPGGRFAVIEMFFEHGCKTFEHLSSHGAIWSSFETYVAFCESVGFKYIDSDVLHTRRGKIDEGDLYPLDDNDCSTDRTVYFEK